MRARVDLLDAFDDERVQIEICPDIDDFEADIVVVATGATRSSEHVTRRDLTLVNLPIFRRIAQECVARLPRALFIVVSNPVELAVQVLTEVADRRRNTLDRAPADAFAVPAARPSGCAGQVSPERVHWRAAMICRLQKSRRPSGPSSTPRPDALWPVSGTSGWGLRC
jgi:hypothetical protein